MPKILQPIFISIFVFALMAEPLVEFYAKNSFAVHLGVLLLAGTFLSNFLHKHLFKTPQDRQNRISHLNCIMNNYGRNTPSPLPYFASEEEYIEATNKREHSILLAAAEKIVEKHMAVLLRKRKQLLYTDDYGLKQRSRWEKELSYFIRNIFIPELQDELSAKLQFTCYLGNSCMEATKDSIAFWLPIIDDDTAIAEEYWNATRTDEFYDGMSGHEYEHYVAELIRQHGWNAQVTSGSGDHGADIIAEKNDIRVAVQCKLYSTPVGNKSVQEAFAAQGFYDCQKSCVVTNNSFTPAARKAAYKLSVSLLHHEELDRYLSEQERL